jgi:hypothetical protein
MNLSILNLFSFFIIIFPILLITGPLIPELVLGIISIYVNYNIIKNKRFFYYKKTYSNFFIIFWIYLLLNSFFSENFIWSFKTSIFYFRYYIFSISIYYLIENNFIKLNKLKISLLITFTTLIIDLFIQYTTGKNIFGLAASDNRYSGFFGDELILGSYMIKFFPLLLLTLIVNNSILSKKNYLFVIFLLFILSLFITGERTATILGIFSIFLFLIVLIKDIKKKIICIGLLLVFPLIILYANPSLKQRFVEDTLNYISLSKYDQYTGKNSKSSNQEKQSTQKKIYIFSKIHHGHYVSAFNLFIEKPIFGNGINTFRINCKKYDHEYNCATHPHNIILQLLSETGLISMIFYLIFIYFLIMNIFFRSNSDGIKVLSIGLLIYIFPIAPSGNFFNNWLNMIFYYLIGFLMFFKLQSKNMLKNNQKNY